MATSHHGYRTLGLLLGRYRCLNPLEVGVVWRHDGIDDIERHGARVNPFEMFGVAVGEREVASPVVPDGGQIHPQIAFGVETEMAVVNAFFMFVEEYKCPCRGRPGDVSGFLIYTVALLSIKNQSYIPSVHVAVDRITPDARIAGTAKNRTPQVGRTAVNPGGLVVCKQKSLFDKRRIGGIRTVAVH